MSAFGTSKGAQNAFIRFPGRKAVVIVLSNRATMNAQELAERLAARLFTK
ncbi:MAG: hypothetical protein JWM95_966 [Gemmatimonadetes bacterium]|nr:hypothetical protein [Gemmatimonadota bacterium]